jgi:hypothetical protein
MYEIHFRYVEGTEMGNEGGTEMQKIRFSNKKLADNYHNFLKGRSDVTDVYIHEVGR